MTVSQFAEIAGVHRQEVVRWAASWMSSGVEGVREERSRGRYGKRYLFSSRFVRRWLDCEIPSPNERKSA